MLHVIITIITLTSSPNIKPKMLKPKQSDLSLVWLACVLNMSRKRLQHSILHYTRQSKYLQRCCRVGRLPKWSINRKPWDAMCDRNIILEMRLSVGKATRPGTKQASKASKHFCLLSPSMLLFARKEMLHFRKRRVKASKFAIWRYMGYFVSLLFSRDSFHHFIK